MAYHSASVAHGGWFSLVYPYLDPGSVHPDRTGIGVQISTIGVTMPSKYMSLTTSGPIGHRR